MKHLTLNKVFFAYAVFVGLVLGGVIGRSTVPYAAALVLAWSLLASLESGVLFFVRAIPLFIAIPLTVTYDNLTLWRPIALALFVKFLLERQTRQHIIEQVRQAWKHPGQWIKTHDVFRRCMLLAVLACLSLIGAAHPTQGILRIIYFTNLSMVPVIMYALIRRERLATRQIIESITISVIIVVVVGFVQLASTYLIDVYQFMRLWGENIQLRQFGQAWSYIAVSVGNTWLAYYGPQLSLRMFSLFPDSHSFPTFVLLGIPALFAVYTKPIQAKVEHTPLKKLFRTRASWGIIWIPLAFLAVILSGTRGIWASSVGAILLAIGLALWLGRSKTDLPRRRVFAYTHTYLIMFFMLFAVAWPIFISPQFLLGKGDLNLLGYRIRSVIDFGETSNALRLAIWKASLQSIKHHPWIGVGIGNFPVVLDQNIELAKAGSTAHNLYLHVAAEMGIFAALEMIVLLGSAWVGTIRWFRRAQGPEMVYAGALMVYLPWILAYVLTDPIIFDERVFLLFATTLALIWANRRKHE